MDRVPTHPQEKPATDHGGKVRRGEESLGKGGGYAKRQIAGWNDRYEKAKTWNVLSFDDVRDWLSATDPTQIIGMPAHEEVIAYYLGKRSLTTDNWTFYEVYGLSRLGVILPQIYYRYHHGRTRNKKRQGRG